MQPALTYQAHGQGLLADDKVHFNPAVGAYEVAALADQCCAVAAGVCPFRASSK
jgi:hypothetical protein